MNIVEKGKETLISVVPIVLIVILLGTTVAPLGASMIGEFLFANFLR